MQPCTPGGSPPLVPSPGSSHHDLQVSVGHVSGTPRNHRHVTHCQGHSSCKSVNVKNQCPALGLPHTGKVTVTTSRVSLGVSWETGKAHSAPQAEGKLNETTGKSESAGRDQTMKRPLNRAAHTRG